VSKQQTKNNILGIKKKKKIEIKGESQDAKPF